MNIIMINPTTKRKQQIGAYCFAVLLLLATHRVTALDFEQPSYNVVPGANIIIRTAFPEPVPNGLEAYDIRISYPAGLFALTPADIDMPPELDHDLFEPGAQRTVSNDFVRVRGFAELGAPYMDTDFISMSVTIPINAPAGTHVLILEPSGPNSFIDSALNVIDGDIVFGTATVTVNVPRPHIRVAPVIDPQTGNLSFFCDNLWPGRRYRIEASTDLDSWLTLDEIDADTEGIVNFIDTDAALFKHRFYRIVDD